MQKIKSTISQKSLLLLATALLLGLFVQETMASQPPPASNTTAPYLVTYTAKLTDSASAPVTTPQTVRFSLWTDSDWTPANVDGVGNIVVASPNYAGWQETYTVTPNADGIFTVSMGSINVLPNFTSAVHVFLEVDVKPSAAPNTSFEVLDPTGNIADTTDRKTFTSSPYAINADTVDNRDAGNGPGNIPILDVTGKLIYGVLPDGVNADTYVLDVNNNAPANVITLQFGGLLGEFLRYNAPLTRFELSKSLNVNGDLTFTGTGNITGATIDGSLNTITNIPITALSPTTRQIRLSPEYDGSALRPDGLANNGRMITGSEDLGPASRFNYYQWTTGKAATQTMDIIVRYQLPTTFVSFGAAPLSLSYETADALAANNKIDLTLKDSTGTAVPLTGASSLTSATWTAATPTFGGAPTFTPGTYIELDIKLSAINGGKFAKVGDLLLNYDAR